MSRYSMQKTLDKINQVPYYRVTVRIQAVRVASPSFGWGSLFSLDAALSLFYSGIEPPELGKKKK